MKKQDIAALIDGKIKGQGSAIDIGGALPAILGGLNENSVAEDMDEDAQMQMRKDLGLYYDLTKTEEKTAEYTDQEFVNYRAKISDDTPAKDELIGVEKSNGELVPITDASFTVADMEPDATVGYSILKSINTQFEIYFKESGGKTPGIYITTTAAETYKGLKYKKVIPDKQGVPEKFLPETDEVEGNPEVPGGTSPTALQGLRINDDYFSIPQGDEVEGNPTVPGGTSPTPLQNVRINNDYFSIPQGGDGVKKISLAENVNDLFGEEDTAAISELNPGDIIAVPGSNPSFYTVASISASECNLIAFYVEVDGATVRLYVPYYTLTKNPNGTWQTTSGSSAKNVTLS